MVSSLMGTASIYLFTSFVLFISAVSGATVTVQAIPADALVDSMGINTHFGFGGTLYMENYTFTRDALINLGIRHIREGSVTSDGREKIMELYRAGIDTQFVLGTRIYPTASGCPATSSCITQAEIINSLFGAVVSVEGINEPDLQKNTSSSWSYKNYTGYPDVARNYGIETYNAMKSNPLTKNIPLGSPAVGDPRNAYIMAPFYDYMDFQTYHPYAGGKPPSQQQLDIFWTDNAVKINGGNKTRPLQASECGYHTLVNNTNGDQPGVPEEAQNKYMPRMWIMFYNFGIIRSYSYEFLDHAGDNPGDSQQFYGIVRYNRTFKPVYYTIKNMINLLKDPNTKFTPGSLTYSHNGNSSIMTTLYQKSNGAYYLAIWFEVSCFNWRTATPIEIGTVPVTLNISASVTSYKVFKISSSATVPILTGSTSVFTVAVPDEVLFIELIVAGATTTTGSVTPPPKVDCTKYNPTMNWTFANGGDSVLVGSHENGWASTSGYVMTSSDRVAMVGSNLELSVSNEGCPAQCGGLPYSNGGWMSAYYYGYGTYTFTAKLPAVSGYYSQIQLYAVDKGIKNIIVLRFAALNATLMSVFWWANNSYVTVGPNRGFSLGFDYSTGFHTYGITFKENEVTVWADGKQIVTSNSTSYSSFFTNSKMSLRVWLQADPGNSAASYFGNFTYTTPVVLQLKSVSHLGSTSLPVAPADCILGNADFGITSANPTTTTGSATTSISLTTGGLPGSTSVSTTNSPSSATTTGEESASSRLLLAFSSLLVASMLAVL